MTVSYKSVGWNRQKKIYDGVVAAGVLVYLALFVVAGLWLRPNITIETLLIRALGTAAIVLLHVVLAIGPLCRLDRRFLPLLYNRRHLGVVTFLVALAHGGFSIVQFHALGDRNPLASVLGSNPRWDSLSQFPFQPLGLAALTILFLMAATSHDFWLTNLTAPVWKRLHMMVYLAYGLVLAHVGLGVLQAETSPILVGVLFAGAGVLLGLQMIAAVGERAGDQASGSPAADDYVDVCAVGDLPEKGARIASLGGERVAIFRYDGKVSAISNVCRHQNGPLGEGRIVNGCVVCPWHGYEYDPSNGASPPPFTETVPTFGVRIDGDRVLVDPGPNPPGTAVEPARIGADVASVLDGEEDGGSFYVGYRARAPLEVARSVRRVVAALGLLVVVLPFVLVAAQGRFSEGVFEYGTVRDFEGILATEPYPTLHVAGDDGPVPHLLVAFGKRGAQAAVAGLDGQRVRTSGQLIYRGKERMIELTGAVEAVAEAPRAPEERSLGTHRLRGEIVDSKCYLGVMKPGRGKPHRACATRCISGGIAPVFVVTDREGATRHLLLVGGDGRAVNAEILAWVAEPLEIEGEVMRTGETLTLRAEPNSFRRIGRVDGG